MEEEARIKKDIKKKYSLENMDDALKNAKQKIVERQLEITQKINAVEFDVHWYRRVFHTFGTSFLLYYLLPSEKWIDVVKVVLLVFIFGLICVMEYLRLRGKIGSDYFFGLRFYEKKRVGSYLYFGVAALLLLLLFPQQIAIPCILCASLGDPIIGELRYRFGKRTAAMLGFFLCLLFFGLTWYKADLLVLCGVSLVGATGAVIGETKKFWWLDDDFMIQMLPAILLFVLWIGMRYTGVDILPKSLLYPVILPW